MVHPNTKAIKLDFHRLQHPDVPHRCTTSAQRDALVLLERLITAGADVRARLRSLRRDGAVSDPPELSSILRLKEPPSQY